jgi:hypothetical protein
MALEALTLCHILELPNGGRIFEIDKIIYGIVFASVVDPPNRRGDKIIMGFTMNECKQVILAHTM